MMGVCGCAAVAVSVAVSRVKAPQCLGDGTVCELSWLSTHDCAGLRGRSKMVGLAVRLNFGFYSQAVRRLYSFLLGGSLDLIQLDVYVHLFGVVPRRRFSRHH